MDQLLRFSEVSEAVNLSRASIYKRIRQGKFPPPRKLNQMCSRWLRSEVHEWMQETTRRDSAETAKDGGLMFSHSQERKTAEGWKADGGSNLTTNLDRGHCEMQPNPKEKKGINCNELRGVVTNDQYYTIRAPNATKSA